MQQYQQYYARMQAQQGAPATSQAATQPYDASAYAAQFAQQQQPQQQQQQQTPQDAAQYAQYAQAYTQQQAMLQAYYANAALPGPR
jgi:hypothetical protein